jgi:NTE family protein
MAEASFKTGLVLSGGGARALSHLGVLNELHRQQVPLDLVVGTSMGAVVGALYAYYREVEPATVRLRRFLQSSPFQEALAVATEPTPDEASSSTFDRIVWMFRKGVYCTHSMLRPTLVSESAYLEVMASLLPDCAIEELPLRFAAVALDIRTGTEVVITRGSLRTAVSASAAIPGLLPPMDIASHTLVDGGWVDNVPVGPARSLGAHLVIAVDTTSRLTDLGPLPITALDLLLRAHEITRIHLSEQRTNPADILLLPQMGPVGWADFATMDRCIEAGRAAAATSMARIKRKRRIRQLTSLKGCIHPHHSIRRQNPVVFY